MKTRIILGTIAAVSLFLAFGLGYWVEMLALAKAARISLAKTRMILLWCLQSG